MRPDYLHIVTILRISLAVAALGALPLERWDMFGVALSALVISILPDVIAAWMGIRLPWPFVAGIVVFVVASLFLGEVFDFYERYWWWDLALHTTSAIGFGLVGFVFIFALFEGDRYAAPPWAIGFISMCLAMAIGVLWEIFEFTMDSLFGLNMQKSGLQDTMWDLIVGTFGAIIAGSAGAAYLKGRERGWLTGLIDQFVRLNERIYRKIRARRRQDGGR